MTVKAYSINDEEFSYTDPGDALNALAFEDRLVEGAVYYEIDTEVVDLAAFMSAETILENAEDQLYGEVGEAAEDAYAASKEAVAELDALIKAWCEKHLGGTTVWRCVGKSREIKVTAADVADYAL